MVRCMNVSGSYYLPPAFHVNLIAGALVCLQSRYSFNVYGSGYISAPISPDEEGEATWRVLSVWPEHTTEILRAPYAC